MTKVKKRIVIVAAALGFWVLLIALFFVFADNTTIEYEEFNITHSTQSGTGVKILHLSDLHFPNVNVDTEQMLARIAGEEPDLIALTGDLIDTGTAIETSGVNEFIERLVNIAPVYFVRGNHEDRNPNSHLLNLSRVTVLDNQSVTRNINGNYITIGGEIGADQDNYTILLTHTPAFASGADLILAGHIHGGQFRLFGQGILCPDRLLFPRYSSGLYTQGETKMIVSRGIGNSIIPFRVNNTPHIPIINISF